MAELLVEQIRPGLNVRGVFALKSKRLLPYREAPGHFLAVTLVDRTGEVEGRLWEGAEEAGARLKVGDIVAVEAQAVAYNGVVQLCIDSIVKENGQIDPARFIPSAEGLEEAKVKLQQLIDSLTNTYLKALLSLLFSNPDFYQAFCLVPAAAQYHHAMLGGLLVHSVGVAAAADGIARDYPQADRDLLVTGALLHDIGKVYEYRCRGAIEQTDEGRLLGHIVSGALLLDRYIARVSDFPEDLRLKLLHILISHHGRYEWQSPKRPKFLEAALLHQLDLLDAQADMFSRAAAGREDKDSPWTGWVKGLDRCVYCR
ncbi:3'-5' exoribonuclease [Desulfofundulus luciae]|uniref:3'-5' exoribonuclease n=1 Tax=Desulfofundulus luciae TaxID=74702 RepID=A0ABU0B0R4_9FIRM|nr:HD domain-containing protein [Desulfofundulus luciae]MDQ0286295.1 3'-5' exoribonuclease [Desulfofundulus luciae]